MELSSFPLGRMIIKILPFLLLSLSIQSGAAINRCSHTINYSDLCPNPMLFSSSSGGKDMVINLTQHHNGTCEFFEGDTEITSVGGIHVMLESFPFTTASPCNHFVKLLSDRNSHLMMTEKSARICQKELGMKVKGTYIWHNFSLAQNQFTYEDLIMDYGHSSFDLQCTHRRRFVLMLFETFKDSKCSLLVQQYQVNDGQNSCEYQRTPSSQQSPGFCGEYPCSGVNSILHELKLIARVPINANSRNLQPPAAMPHGEQVHNHHESSPSHKNVQIFGGGASSNSAGGSENKQQSKYKMATTTTESPTTTSGPLGDQKPIDWAEWSVRLFFPVIGLAFIFLLLRILKGRYVNELCGRQQGHPNPYFGSTASIDKHNGLH